MPSPAPEILHLLTAFAPAFTLWWLRRSATYVRRGSRHNCAG